MDAINLEEYQKRLQEIQNTLEETLNNLQNQAQERVANLQTSLENNQNELKGRIEEAQSRLEEAQGSIDMSDFSNVIDRRRITVREEYPEGREGYLLSEYDKRRMDGYVGPKYKEIEEEVRAIREARREEQIGAIMAEISALENEQVQIIQSTQEEQEKVTSQIQEEREQAEISAKEMRQQIVTELQTRQEQIQTEIAKADAQKESIYKKIEEIKEIIAANQQAIGIKGLSNSVFKAAVKAKQDCINKKRAQQERLDELNKEIEDLKGDYYDIDELLYQIDGRKEAEEIARQEAAEKAKQEAEEIARQEVAEKAKQEAEEMARQEDEMWTAYEELAKKKSELEENKEYVMNAEMELHNGDYVAEEEKTQKVTEREIRGYGDTGITQEVGADGLPLGPFRVPVETKTTQSPKVEPQQQAPVQPPKAQPTKPQAPQPNPVQSTQPQQPNPAQPPISSLSPNGPFAIEKAGLYISDSGMPTYYVALVDSKGKEEFISTANGYYSVIVPGKEQEPELQSLQNQLIANPKKYYDFGLAGLLQEVDKKFGTSGISDYQKMLKDRDSDVLFDIEYDLTKLGEIPIDEEDKVKVKYLKKLANASEKEGIATYEKAPNFIISKISKIVKGLVERVTTKQLESSTQDNQTPKKPTPEEIVEMYKKSLQDKNFDIEQFIKDCQMTLEEADELRKIHENRVKSAQVREEIAEKAPEKQSAETTQTTEQLNYSEEEIGAICNPFRRMYGNEILNISDLEKKMEDAGISEFEKTIIRKDYEKDLADRDLIRKGIELEKKELDEKGKKSSDKRGNWLRGLQLFGSKQQSEMPNGTRVAGPKATEKETEKLISTDIMRRFQIESRVSNFNLEKFAQENGLNQSQIEELERKIKRREEIKENQTIYKQFLEQRKSGDKREEGIEPGDE